MKHWRVSLSLDQAKTMLSTQIMNTVHSNTA
jgi:hypothetical protein